MKIERGQIYHNVYTKADYKVKDIKGLKVILLVLNGKEAGENIEVHLSNIKNTTSFMKVKG